MPKSIVFYPQIRAGAARTRRRENMTGLTETPDRGTERLDAGVSTLAAKRRAMDEIIKRLSAAETAGDVNAVDALSQVFAAVANLPGYRPETDPEYLALDAVLENAGEENGGGRLSEVLDGLGDLNRHLGRFARTPLGMALKAPGRSADRVRMFIGRGARAGFASPDGHAPLHQICDYMWTGDRGDDPKELAAIVETLVGAGADLEARTNSGLTPLICAAMTGTVAEMRALLEAGADPNARIEPEDADSETGASLLVLVASEPEKLSLLLDYGANIEKSGVLAHIERELAWEDVAADADQSDALRKSMAVISARRLQ